MVPEEKGTTFDNVRVVDYSEHCEMMVSFDICKECWTKVKQHLDAGLDTAIDRRVALERWDKLSKDRFV